MEFYNVMEDSYPLYELCIAEGWYTGTYDEFFQDGAEFGFFKGDPDMIKIDGELGYFCECRGNVYYLFDDMMTHNAETMLRKFFSTYKTGITLGGEGYAWGDNPKGVKDVHGDKTHRLWDIWEKMETGIAFRGGGGYSYWISDWSEWAEKHLAVA